MCQYLLRILVSVLITQSSYDSFHLLNNRLDKICCFILTKPSLCIGPDRCQSEGMYHTHSFHISASVAEPGRPLSGPLHNPLVFVLLAWCLALVQDDGLHSRRPQRAAFHCLYLLTNQTSLLAHLSITEATQDMFLLQVATLWTRLNVGLRGRDREWRLGVKQCTVTK